MSDSKFLNLYFRNIYNRLEADALLFNRKLPHSGLMGSENETALADVLRGFFPSSYGVEVNALVIDRTGAVTKQCDIVIYENSRFPKYFRKVFPIELVYAVIEVKTELTGSLKDAIREHHESLRRLDHYPELTPYWNTRTEKEKIVHDAPLYAVFGYRTETKVFETFALWFESREIPQNVKLHEATVFNKMLVCALDKGILKNPGDGHMQRWVAVKSEDHPETIFEGQVYGKSIEVDPAKSLFLFLETLWQMLWQLPRHPGFDIRSYMNADLGEVIPVDSSYLFGIKVDS